MPDISPQAAYERRRRQSQRRVHVWLSPKDAALFDGLRAQWGVGGEEVLRRLIRDAVNPLDP